MKLCVLCNGYPSKRAAESVFVARLCDAFADLDTEVSIIAPQSLSRIVFRRGVKNANSFEHITSNNNVVKVFRPQYVSFGKTPILTRLNALFRDVAINKVLRKLPEQDAYYGHFWYNGYSLFKAIKKTRKPLFVATGESTIRFQPRDKAFKDYVTGVISVSSKNSLESIKLGLTTQDKIILLPNSIDSNEFYLMDKETCRKELDLPIDKFIVAFVGNFSERKGALRLAKAIDMCGNDEIGVLFLGRPTEVMPTCNGILKCGFVEHHMIATYLNASDVYVLPTLAEGCSNSIVEAMACGLPIISSDLPFNYDILDSSNSILIDPMDESAIFNSIMTLKQDPARLSSMSRSSLDKAKDMDLSVRAGKILKYIKVKIESHASK